MYDGIRIKFGVKKATFGYFGAKMSYLRPVSWEMLSKVYHWEHSKISKIFSWVGKHD